MGAKQVYSRSVASDLVPALLAGGFALAGSLGGIIAAGRFAQRAEQRRIAADDERRWLAERRRIYAAYLVLATSMLKEIDSVGVFLSYDGTTEISSEDQSLISEGLSQYFRRWDNELQPALVEVQLIATPKVADLAERATGALMEITGSVESKQPFTDYYPGWFQARDLLQVLQNSMRAELGVSEALLDPFPKPDDWPWLSDRPGRESYVQERPVHRRTDRADAQDSGPAPTPPKQAPDST